MSSFREHIEIRNIERIVSGLRGWRYLEYIPIAFIFLFHSILNIFYILKDTRPPAWDQSLHLTLSLIYYRLIRAGRFSDIIGVSGYYPPFFHILTTPLYTFGISEDVAICVNLIYLAILFFSVYGIGKLIFNKKAGFLAATIISFYPFLINLQRDYLLDFALISMISLSLYLLLKSDNFKDRRYSALFGLAFALTVLTKWTGIFFLIGPVLWVFYKAYTSKKVCAYCGKDAKDVRHGIKWFCSEKHKVRYLKEGKPLLFSGAINNFLIAFFIFILVAGAWYVPNFGRIYQSVAFFAAARMSQTGITEEEPEIISLQSFAYYLNAINVQILLFFSILTVIGLIFLFKSANRDYRDKKIFFGLSVLIPYLLFTLTKNKDTRYTIPLLIFFAILSAFWIMELRNERVKKVVVSLILIIGILQTSSITFGSPALNLPNIYPSVNYPREENWKVKEALDSISASLPKEMDHIIIVVVLPDHPYVNGRTYEYYAVLRNEPYSIYNGAYIPFDVFQKSILGIDYIICKEGGEIGSYGGVVPKMYETFEEVKVNFESLGFFDLPDGSKLVVYKNRGLR
jgi:hypothetical protein